MCSFLNNLSVPRGSTPWSSHSEQCRCEADTNAGSPTWYIREQGRTGSVVRVGSLYFGIFLLYLHPTFRLLNSLVKFVP